MDYYRGRIAMVTGSAAGIGRALCLELARNGATVIATGRRLDTVQMVVDEIEAAGGKAAARQLDVGESDAFQQAASETLDAFGRIDFLFNNAGIGVGGEFRDISLDQWTRVIRVNLLGVVHGCRAVYPFMIRRGFGHIVNIASLGGLLPFPVKTPYAATKHAVVGFSSTLRAEAAALGVRVNTVCPGLVRTEIWTKTPVMKASASDVLGIIKVPMHDPAVSARTILKGVRRNRAMIVFPLHAALLWRLYRLFPWLLTPMGVYMMRAFRKIRKPEPGDEMER